MSERCKDQVGSLHMAQTYLAKAEKSLYDDDPQELKRHITSAQEHLKSAHSRGHISAEECQVVEAPLRRMEAQLRIKDWLEIPGRETLGPQSVRFTAASQLIDGENALFDLILKKVTECECGRGSEL